MRNISGINYATPIRSQMVPVFCGSCWCEANSVFLAGSCPYSILFLRSLSWFPFARSCVPAHPPAITARAFATTSSLNDRLKIRRQNAYPDFEVAFQCAESAHPLLFHTAEPSGAVELRQQYETSRSSYLVLCSRLS